MNQGYESVDLSSLEQERLIEQRRLDSQLSRELRNEAGQFATPPALADDIAKAAARFCEFEQIRFLEPAVGTGAFFAALLRNFPKESISLAMGVELNAASAESAKRLWGAKGLNVINHDFTAIEITNHDTERAVNLILTNPPYVRHHHLGKDEKLRLQKLASQVVGRDVSGLSGLYTYFVLAAHQWLADGGLGAWLIPSEFMDVNYGEALRRYFSRHVSLVQIHRFDPSDVQFADALVSSAVVIYRRRVPEENHTFLLSHGGTVSDPHNRVEMSLSRLTANHKWSRLFVDESVELSEAENPLSALFRITRGIATGANEFFIMRRQELAARGIDERFVKPILPSARLLDESVIEGDDSGFPLVKEQLAVIDTDLDLEEIKKSCIGLWEYLQKGEQDHIAEAYLLTKRVPWYRQEQRPPAPFLCTYMGRTKADGRTFRFFWNRSKAIAANTYLLLYPIGSLKAALDEDPTLCHRVLEILTELKSEGFTNHGRVYGGGLFKIEPKELGRVDASAIVKALNLRVPTQARLMAM